MNGPFQDNLLFLGVIVVLQIFLQLSFSKAPCLLLLPQLLENGTQT